MLDSVRPDYGVVKSDALKTALVSLQRRLTHAEEALSTSEKERANLQHELSVVKGDAAKARTELSAAIDRTRLLEGNESARVANLQTETRSLQQGIASLLEEKASWQNTYRDLQHERCQLAATLDATKRELQASSQTQTCLQSQVHCAAEQQDATNKELVQLRNLHSQLQADYSSSQHECKKLQQRALSLEALYESTKSRFTEQEQSARLLSRRCDEREATVAKLESKLLEVNAESKQQRHLADAAREQAMQALDTKRTLEQMCCSIQQQQQKYTMPSQDVQQLQCQLQASTSQLQVVGEKLRVAEAELATGNAQLIEKQQESAKQIMQLEEKLSEAVKRSEHYRNLCTMTPESAPKAQQDLLQQLQSANNHAMQQSQVVTAQERDIRALQQALEAVQREKAEMQCTLCSVMEQHAGFHSDIVETRTPDSEVSTSQAPGVLKNFKGGKTKRVKGAAHARLHRSLSPVAMSSTSGPGARMQTLKRPQRKCGNAAATAAAIKDRNHAAIKAHVTTRGGCKSRCTSSFRDEATTDRIARGAANSTIKLAEKQESAAEARATRRDMEGQYLRKYSEYRELLADKGAFCKSSTHEVRHVVQLMDELNKQAQQLLCNRNSLSPIG